MNTSGFVPVYLNMGIILFEFSYGFVPVCLWHYIKGLQSNLLKLDEFDADITISVHFCSSKLCSSVSFLVIMKVGCILQKNIGFLESLNMTLNFLSILTRGTLQLGHKF
ncbi:zeaxanthin epoxidase, chloroplastic [Gossypium australe]|uniref:Zeaxanthin epoxidase, chloroplastic n=1 Tax=Gossypium australe TaxID=47621 RepID=A0A5B6VZ61_9ROSI|nr:zeaxanthin epoxidase, chloroplastic [Gossypium australe]